MERNIRNRKVVKALIVGAIQNLAEGSIAIPRDPVRQELIMMQLSPVSFKSYVVMNVIGDVQVRSPGPSSVLKVMLL